MDAHYRSLVDLGLDFVVGAVGKLNLDEDTASRSLEQCWLLSILQLLWIDLPSLSTFDPDTQDSTVNQFQVSDIDHIKTGAERVKRIWASNSVDVRNRNQYESDVLASQASLGAKSRRHLPVRTLFQEAKGVLMGVKPCWVMSPLLVAQVLPGEKCFDLVVFDEASQIPPADAVSTLLRGRQTIVAGDPFQLPPTPFFASGSVINSNGEEDDDEDDGDDENLEEQISKEDLAAQRTQVRQGQTIALVEGQESLLDLMKALLPPPHGTKMLKWHYRSRFEALIAFSNAQEFLYDWRLTTFPSTGIENCISYVLVPFTAGTEEASASAGPEVNTVVELAIEHAEQSPKQTLGIIALGSKHANRIRGALQAALETRNDIAKFFDESGAEGFFIKNLESVQGDERDAIILTTGYSRRKDGGMRYNFGPINQAHGHRRLNVAITRAKFKLTLVSSFSSADMDDQRLTSLGPRMLKDYLAYAESEGTDLGRQMKVKPEMNAFERDVYESLQNQGLKLIPQFGDSGYWIDFAVMHPDLPGKPILAIEADGAMYHSSPTARDRDRLRQQQLEDRGWRFHRIWSTAWFRTKEEEITKAVQVYKELLKGPTSSPIVEDAGPEPDEAPSPSRIPSREAPPRVRRGLSIDNYPRSTLISVIVWIESDGKLRTDDEMLSEVITFLGFKRHGIKIVAAINTAIKSNKSKPKK
jgi:very-short-patch-repair endonuclease